MVNCPSCGEENPPKFRLCGFCGTPLKQASPPHEVRKTVTIIFCDLKNSTALGERLDPEALHEVKARYFNAMATEINRHGGKIEKYIGDAIMAVFGLPRAHEDDALRAVRAVTGMQAALGRVNEDLQCRYGVMLANRTGVNTGEVVATDDPNAKDQLVTGDAVNVAARLEQAAPENEIYLGEKTFRLVRDAVEVEAVEPLEVKGKTERVPAYRLISARGLDGNVRRIDTPIVGRDEELATLDATYREVGEGRVARLVTVVGDAGVGKSRLVHEVLKRVAIGARVLRGRCLAYGEGITFWPLVGMAREAADIRDDDSSDEACAKLLTVVGDKEIAQRLASAIGLTAAPFSLQELYWAARRFLETLATQSPVVAFVDDIHWAEPAFLDLLDYILDTCEDAPVLLLATARHDLLEERPQWGERQGATRLVLRPLADAESTQIVVNLIGAAGLSEEVVKRIVNAAEGNPLFVEQMLSMLIDSRALRLEEGRWVRAETYGEITVPPTIQALLEARIDKLVLEVRAAVESASVIGLEFPLPAVEALSSEALRPVVGEHLATLTRKLFIRPLTSEAEVRFRFHHQLVRDTVYSGLLKRARATLHVEFVRWADRLNAERGRELEFEEILGYHLEQAHRYLCELGPLDADGIALGEDAARRLSRAARRTFARGDMHAAANLYRRAAALLAEDDPKRLALLPELAEALMELGDFANARAVLGEATAAAEKRSDHRLKASAQLVAMRVRLYSAEPGEWGGETLRIANDVIPILERESAHDELATAWRLIGLVHGVAGRYGPCREALGEAIVNARLAGNQRLVARIGMGFATSALLGPTPVLQAIEQCEKILADGLSDRQAQGSIMCTIAQLRAMSGDFGVARSLYRAGRTLLRDLGQGVNAASTGLDVARVELLAGDDLARAEQMVRADFEFLQRTGETYFLSTMAALLSRIVCEQQRVEEALSLSKIAEDAAAADDVEAQVLWRIVRVPILAQSGELAEAEATARTALELAQRSEVPMLQADTLFELAVVLQRGGQVDPARNALREAIALYTAKGDLTSAARATTWAERAV